MRPRPIRLASTAFVVVLSSLLPLGCGEPPTSPDPSADPHEESAVDSPPLAPTTVEESLSDPFVAELMAGLDDRAAARLDRSLRAVRMKAGSGQATETRMALVGAIGVLEAIDLEGPDDDIALAVLELVLRDLADGTAVRPHPAEGGP